LLWVLLTVNHQLKGGIMTLSILNRGSDHRINLLSAGNLAVRLNQPVAKNRQFLVILPR